MPTAEQEQNIQNFFNLLFKARDADSLQTRASKLLEEVEAEKAGIDYKTFTVKNSAGDLLPGKAFVGKVIDWEVVLVAGEDATMPLPVGLTVTLDTIGYQEFTLTVTDNAPCDLVLVPNS